jgi:hypothetical protein
MNTAILILLLLFFKKNTFKNKFNNVSKKNLKKTTNVQGCVWKIACGREEHEGVILIYCANPGTL